MPSDIIAPIITTRSAETAWRTRRNRLLAIALVVLAACGLLRQTLRKMPDFEVYWRTAHRAAAGEPINRPEDGHYQFKYLPAFAFVMIPFGALPLPAAKIAWFYVVVGAEIGLVSLTVASLPHRRRSANALAVIVAVLSAKFFAHELTLGQSNTLMALAVVGAMSTDLAGHSVSTGLLVAAAIVFKPYAIVFVPFLIWTRRFVAAALALVGVAAALATPMLTYGARGTISIMQQWIQTLTASTPAVLLNQDNVSIWAMYAKWMGETRTAALLAAVTCAAFLGYVAYVTARSRSAEVRYAGAAATLMLLPLWSPQGWDYVLLIGTPAVAIVVDRWTELPRLLRAIAAVALLTMSFTIFDLLGRQLYARFMSTSGITVCALIVVAATGQLAIRAADRPDAG